VKLGFVRLQLVLLPGVLSQFVTISKRQLLLFGVAGAIWLRFITEVVTWLFDSDLRPVLDQERSLLLHEQNRLVSDEVFGKL
jgi:hypothetical protein